MHPPCTPSSTHTQNEVMHNIMIYKVSDSETYTTLYFQTYLDLNPYLWLLSDMYFSDPLVLRPERWLRDSAGTLAVDPYILNPFSIGTRMCAGECSSGKGVLYFQECDLI